ncbi:MAG: hypothetical protein LJE94_07010 [Deltaproteobacteria bacterium]|nr:hypothetical protein [Deltaproteobacteria bacterium]
MSEYSRYIAMAGVIVLGIILQAMLIGLYAVPAPYKTAVAFTKAYYKLDPSMEDYLCQDSRLDDGVNVTAQYLYEKSSYAKSLGFDKSFLKSQLYHIETHTAFTSDTEATVTISAVRRTAINPVFAWVAKLFRIGGTYPVEGTIDVVKENGRWKVCAESFSSV